MKNLFPIISTFLLLLIVISCKKDKDPSPKFEDITATPCKLEYLNLKNYKVEYGADDKIFSVDQGLYLAGSGVPYDYSPLWYFQYEKGLLKRILNRNAAPGEPNANEENTIFKFDYGSQGIEKVYHYEYKLDLVYRYDFEYDNFNKPTSMIVYLNMNQGGPGEDVMKAINSLKYEYDSNGNIVKEYFNSLQNPESPNNYVATYTYDSSPNSVKLLESLVFSYRSGPIVFSSNNLTESEVKYANDDNRIDRSIVTHFDNNHNVFVTRSFFGIEWDCN